MFQQGPGSIAPNVAEQIRRQFGIAHGVLNIRDATSGGERREREAVAYTKNLSTSRVTYGKGEYHCLVVHNSVLGVGHRGMA